MAWNKDNAMRLSSSLAYYLLVSIAPLLLLAVSIAGLLLGEEDARRHVSSMLLGRFGEDAKLAIDAFLYYTSDQTDSVIGTTLGLFALFGGASAALGELQSAMNTVWEVAPRPGRGLRGILRDRVVSFAMVGGVALLLLVLLVVGGALALIGKHVGTLPGGVALWQGVDFALSIVAVTALFALSYKLVPDVVIPLREVLPGAFLTGGLFLLGELALGIYLTIWTVPKPHGVAGSIVVLVIWLHYSSQIMFYGVEFTKVRAAARGIDIVPRRNAVRLRRANDDQAARRPTD